jgi:hypothetical protein
MQEKNSDGLTPKGKVPFDKMIYQEREESEMGEEVQDYPLDSDNELYLGETEERQKVCEYEDETEIESPLEDL